MNVQMEILFKKYYQSQKNNIILTLHLASFY